jgi:hypothetical protein
MQSAEGGERWNRPGKRSHKIWPNNCVGSPPAVMTRGWHGASYRRQVVDGVYQLDVGAVLDGFSHFLQALGVMHLAKDIQGAAIQRVMVPIVQYVLLYGLKTLSGIESINALPAMLFSDEAVMRLLGF